MSCTCSCYGCRDADHVLDVDRLADALLARLMDNGYVVASWEAIRAAMKHAAYNPSLDEALNSGDGSYRP